MIGSAAAQIGELLPARDPRGEPSLAIRVSNTGGRALDLTGKVTLADGPAGMKAGPFEVVQGTTLAPHAVGRGVSRRFVHPLRPDRTRFVPARHPDAATVGAVGD